MAQVRQTKLPAKYLPQGVPGIRRKKPRLSREKRGSTWRTRREQIRGSGTDDSSSVATAFFSVAVWLLRDERGNCRILGGTGGRFMARIEERCFGSSNKFA